MKEIAFIGGDMRQVRVINNMSKKFGCIKIYGFDKLDTKKFDENVKLCEDVSEAVSGACAVILPLPYTLSRETVNAPFCENEIHTGDVLRCMGEKQILLIGKADEGIRAVAKLYGVRAVDYFEREELVILNAIPTAEGAIEIAMRETPYTVGTSRCLVLGNGRIGKVLSKMLDGIGSEVTVCVRKYKDRAYCKAVGIKSMFFNNLSEEIGNYDLIFNTVPSCIIDYKVLKNVRSDSLIIDLASKPGGAEFVLDNRN